MSKFTFTFTNKPNSKTYLGPLRQDHEQQKAINREQRNEELKKQVKSWEEKTLKLNTSIHAVLIFLECAKRSDKKFPEKNQNLWASLINEVKKYINDENREFFEKKIRCLAVFDPEISPMSMKNPYLFNEYQKLICEEKIEIKRSEIMEVILDRPIEKIEELIFLMIGNFSYPGEIRRIKIMNNINRHKRTGELFINEKEPDMFENSPDLELSFSEFDTCP